MILHLFAALAALVVVDADLSDGRQLRGELTSVATDGVTLELNGEARRLSRNELRSAGLPSPAANPIVKGYVRFVDDTLVTVDKVQSSAGAFTIETGQRTLQADVSSMREVRWIEPGDTDAAWNEVVAESEQEDLLVIRREASLDYLKGTVLDVTDANVLFEYNGQSIPAPRAKVAGFVLARKEQAAATPRLRILTNNGSVYVLRSAKMFGDGLVALVTMANVRHQISLEDVTRIEFPQLGAVYLSDLETASTTVTPYFGSKLEPIIQKLNEPRLDRSFDDGPIRIWDPSIVGSNRTFKKGLALQSRTELTYRLAGKYQRFQTAVGMDPDAPSLADVELRIYFDEREVFYRSVSGKDPLIPVDVSAVGAKRMRILVDYGGNVDIGDRLHLGDARLLK